MVKSFQELEKHPNGKDGMIEATICERDILERKDGKLLPEELLHLWIGSLNDCLGCGDTCGHYQ